MKIQAISIQTGDRIVAYCNNKMQICTVKHLIDAKLNNISLSVSISNSRNSSHTIRFRRDALVELHAKFHNEDEVGFCTPQEPVAQ